jgi:beta-lactam-binding protein with PASTA domain
VRQFNADVREGFVFDQQPDAGERIDRGNTVTIFISRGPPKVDVPDVVGKTVDEARNLLRDQGLRVEVMNVYSSGPVGTVVNQDPAAGKSVIQGTPVQIKVSQGPRPVGVPPVIGKSYDDAAAELTAAGFVVGRVDVESNRPAGTVVGQDPGANTLQPPGTKIILSVSNGPATTAVPEVEGLERSQAVAELRNAGFTVTVEEQDTEDPAEDGIVLSQDPGPGDQAQPGSSVVIVVGKLVNPTTTTTTTGEDTGGGATP